VSTKVSKLSRRDVVKIASASAALPLVHIRTGRAAGKVSVGFWDHWVPEGNAIMKKQCEAFGAAHQVEVQADFITSVGSKNILTMAAEAQAKTGNDIYAFDMWSVHEYAAQLDPVDDILYGLIVKYGQICRAFESVRDDDVGMAGVSMIDVDMVDAVERAARRKTHVTIQRVTKDIDPRMHLNTAVSSLMELVNELVALSNDRSRTRPETGAVLREGVEAAACPPLLVCKNCGQHYLEGYYHHFLFEEKKLSGGDLEGDNVLWEVSDESDGNRVLFTNRFISEIDAGDDLAAQRLDKRRRQLYFCRSCGTLHLHQGHCQYAACKRPGPLVPVWAIQLSERGRLMEEQKDATKKRAAEIKKRLAVIEKERVKILAVAEYIEEIAFFRFAGPATFAVIIFRSASSFASRNALSLPVLSTMARAFA